jgi:succinate dehydrogenase / fumarate reductase flavoprotein subunit
MTVNEDSHELVSTDVLIVGGGIGGLVTAVKAKEANPDVDVLVVEKQTAGWAGKATKIGGILAFLGPQNKAEAFIDFQVKTSGFFLNDQDLLAKYVQSTYQAVEDFQNWGAKVARTPDGKLVTIPAFWAPEWSLTFVDIDLMLPVRARARKLGARFLDKIHVVDLLKQENRVVGAVGFNIVTGKFYVFKAKATILANGSCGYKVRRFWVAGTGDGIAAAYRAGAEMRNAEYGNLYGHTVWKDTDSGMVGHQFLVNSAGENLAQKYLPDDGPTGVFLPVPLAIGLEKEIAEGRGPIYYAPPPEGGGFGMRSLPKLEEWQKRMEEKENKYGLPPGTRRQIEVPLHGETSCVKVDHEMRTTLEGLWAIGDTSYAGSAVAGAVCSPPGVTPGSGIMFAVVSGTWAGPSAARYAAGKHTPEDISTAELKDVKKSVFAPFESSGGMPPREIIDSLQEITAPIKYSLRRSKDRLNEALAVIENLRKQLPELQAGDFHYLSKCHEVKSMVLCAELTCRAALMREESRGSHFREDFPQRDDKNWLKWIILKQQDGEMKLSAQPVPVEKYPIKPGQVP